MAGDWIKMRPSLLTSPKVNGIARELEGVKEVTKTLSIGFNGSMSEIVTRNVMRNVTVASLLVIWGAANEHTTDGIFHNADLSDLDDMVGIPGFGAAMESVGWAEYDEENCAVILPNFNEYNTCAGERTASAKTSAQRQKEYRDRKKLQQSDVTSDVTSNRREEKRREDIKPTSQPGAVGSEKFQMHIGWMPSVHVADLAKQANVTIKPEKLPEFIAHWLTQTAQRTQSEWDKALLQSAMHDRNRDAGKPDAGSKLQSGNLAKFDPVAFVNGGQSQAEGGHGRTIENAA